MKKLILVANDAQACGKTSIALVLDEYLGRKQVKRLLAVTSQPQQELPCATEILDLEERIRASEVADLLMRTDALIIDVHTEGNVDFGTFFRDARIDDILTELDAELTVVIPVCDDAEVLRGAKEVAEAYSGLADFLVVKSPLLADVPEAWLDSLAHKALELLGAVEISAPAVPDGILDEIDAMELDLPLALTQRQLLPRYMRTELLGWEVAFSEQLHSVAALIVPEPTADDDLHGESVYGKTLTV